MNYGVQEECVETPIPRDVDEPDQVTLMVGIWFSSWPSGGPGTTPRGLPTGSVLTSRPAVCWRSGTSWCS